MRQTLLTILACVICLGTLHAQEVPQVPQGLTFESEPSDTLHFKKKMQVNNYSAIGVEYGVSRNSMNFNPAYKQQSFIMPGYYGITYTKYCRMMGMFPFFAFQTGLFYGTEGYQFKKNEDTGYISTVDNATKAVMHVVEVPVLAMFHFDVTHARFYAMAGPYGGYRLDIERFDQVPEDEYVKAFKDHDRQIDYGLHGGAGFSLIFAPVELNVNLRVRYGWSNIWQPNYYSQYYYRFGYPFDFMLSAGVSIQLSKRYGKTKAMIRKEAYKKVYEPEDTTR